MQLLLTLLSLLIFACSAPSQSSNEQGPNSQNFNQLTLAAIHTIPSGGGYSGSDATKNKLPLACRLGPEGLHFTPQSARPSFCSGATYLVFLQALQNKQSLSKTITPALIVAPDQQDGTGIFGRWNANGPGCAKLVADLACGQNFTSWENAQPGDFLKIWWNEHIGGRERGHHVVYLSHDATNVRFWSSNQPNGYGEKTIPRTQCKRVLFTRITQPEKISAITRLPKSDPWLTRMLTDDFTWAEVSKKCQVRN